VGESLKPLIEDLGAVDYVMEKRIDPVCIEGVQIMFIQSKNFISLLKTHHPD
jgi:hypothetical protein